MLEKEGFPEERELVLCTVTGIQRHAVFCTLDEYGGRTGMVHISEVAAGRVKNIKEYVQEGKKVVCKVLRVNKEKGYIDLSIRRVNEGLRRQKMNELKQAQLCEKIINNIAKQEKKDPVAIYKMISEKVLAKYPSLFDGFEAVSHDEDKFEKMGVEKKIAATLTEAVKTRIKPPELFIEGDFIMTTYDPEGVDLVRQALAPVEKATEIKYRGAGTYRVRIKTDDYKKGEKVLKGLIDGVLSTCKKKKIKCDFVRKEE